MLIYSCGGGGGGSSSSNVTPPPAPPPAPPPSPTIDITASNDSITARGGKSTITWNSTNTTQCNASGNWEGSKELNGSIDITLNIPGEYTYTLSCSGDGGDVNASVTISSTSCSSLDPLTKPKLIMGQNAACLLDQTGLNCFGRKDSWVYEKDSSSNYIRANIIPELTNPMMISGTNRQFCALDDNGVSCWGSGPQWHDYDLLSEVPNLSCPTFVDVEENTACAIDDNGISCWGDLGQPGTGTDYITKAVEDFSLRNPYLLKIAYPYICAVDDDGIQCGGQSNPYKLPQPNYGIKDITDITATSIPGTTYPQRTVLFYAIGTAVDENDLSTQVVREWGGGGPISYHLSPIPDERNNKLVWKWGFYQGTLQNQVYRVVNPVSGGMAAGRAFCVISKEHCNYYYTDFYTRSYGDFYTYACNGYSGTRNERIFPESNGLWQGRKFPSYGGSHSHSITSSRNALQCTNNDWEEYDDNLKSKYGQGGPAGIPRLLDGKASVIGMLPNIQWRCKYGIDPSIENPSGSYRDCNRFGELGKLGATEFYDTGEKIEVLGMPSIVQNPLVVGTRGNVTCVLQSDVLVDDLVVKIAQPEIPAIECWGDTITTHAADSDWEIPFWDNNRWKDPVTFEYIN